MKTSLRKDQGGIAHLLIIVLVVVVLAGVGFAAWWVFVKNKDDTPAAIQNASQEAQDAANTTKTACMSQYDDQDLCNMIAVQTANPFEQRASVITMTGTSLGTNNTLVVSSDGQGNSQTNMTSDGETYNYISFNGITYFQYETGGTWYTYGSSSNDATEETSSIESGLDAMLSSLTTTTYTKVGQEACGNLTCLKYQIIDSDTPNSSYTVWFDTTDYMLRQFYQADENGELTMVVDYQAVTITAPSPVEDMSSLYDGYYPE